MTVATTINRLSFNGDDTTILFTYTFKVFEESDIKVIVRSALGVETTLTLDTDYTVTVSETAGGTVTLIGTYAATPPATGETIIVYREIPYTQEIDPVENDPQRADVAEEGLDRAVILIQQLKDAISRSIQLPISTTYSGLALPEPEAAKYLGWNDAGTELENRDLISSVGVSPFMTTVLDDTTAAAARTTLGAMANPMSAPGDIIYGGASGAPTKLIKGTASQVLTMNSGATAPEWATVAPSGLPLGYITGLTIAHAADTEHDITVAAGEARDATDADDMVLASAITKQFDAAWSVGTNKGGFAAGESLPASGTIHIWLIKRSDTGVVDVMANNHATTGLTPTLPANYDYKRRIFSLRTDASNNIINGDQWGTGIVRTWIHDTRVADIAATNPGTNAVLAAVSVPGGIKVRAFIQYRYTDPDSADASQRAILTSPDSADVAPAAFTTYTMHDQPGENNILTNTSSQIRYRLSLSNANTGFEIWCIGWEDTL